MVNQIVYVFRLEFVQDRDGHGTVCSGGEEAYSPVRLILRTQSHLVAFFETAFLKADVNLLDEFRKVFVSEGGTVVVRKCLSFPIRPEAALYQLINRFKFHNLI